ncbi:hypothetical protein [Dermatobacter hominis]|uniref:hypothetical protein n=1 Tax=Dermatobacter hominis TaxID=2884263 RepID=UPI001D10E93C|nr:hypothetical protein [Dermatobacter hominis]UDY34943.1 hypothetical protein LH044_16590 [Dermatobacter hominis]
MDAPELPGGRIRWRRHLLAMVLAAAAVAAGCTPAAQPPGPTTTTTADQGSGSTSTTILTTSTTTPTSTTPTSTTTTSVTTTTTVTTSTSVPTGWPQDRPLCMKSSYGDVDLEYVVDTLASPYTAYDENGQPYTKYHLYNSLRYPSSDGTCSGAPSRGFGIVFLDHPTDAVVQAACLEQFDNPSPPGWWYFTVEENGWPGLGDTAWMC